MKRLTLIVIVAAAVVLVVGFVGVRVWLGGGGELADSRFSRVVEGAPRSLEVVVEGVSREGLIDPAYTCDGLNVPPRVSVSGIPGSAGYLALVMYDPDAPGGTFVHWLAVEPAGGPQAEFPGPAMVEGVNDFGRPGYGGPCPPKGGGAHRYFFLVLALSGDPGLPPGYQAPWEGPYLCPELQPVNGPPSP